MSRIAHCRSDNRTINVSNSQHYRPALQKTTSICGLKHVLSTLKPTIGESTKNGVLYMSNTSSSSNNTYMHTIYTLPNIVVLLLIILSEWLDYICNITGVGYNWSFLKLVTANNVAYCSAGGLLNQPMLEDYVVHSEELYMYACNSSNIGNIGNNSSNTDDTIINSTKNPISTSTTSYSDYFHSINTPRIDMIYMNNDYMMNTFQILVKSYTNTKNNCINVTSNIND